MFNAEYMVTTWQQIEINKMPSAENRSTNLNQQKLAVLNAASNLDAEK